MKRTTPALLLACLFLSPALAQEAPRPADPLLPERVYVPIEDFDRIFDRERGGVFVPMEDLKKLIARANAQPQAPEPPPEVRPPADYVLVGAKFQGLAGERVVTFQATFDVEVLEEEDWVVIPIGLGEASLADVRTRGDRQAVVGPMALLAEQVAARDAQQGRKRVRQLPKQGYGIVLRGAGRLQTTATFAVPIHSKPGESHFRLSLPGSALTHFETTLPQSGLRVRVDQALATEEESLAEADQTRVRAYFGAAAEATVTWNPKPKEVEGAERDPLLFAETETSLRLDEGVLQTTTRIAYRILQAPCGEFRVRFPRGYTLLGVSGENMSSYPVPEADGDGQTIAVRLHEKAKDRYALEVRLEKILGDETGQVAFPRIATVGTERESGLLAARASEFLSLEPAVLRGVSQIDAGGITKTLAQDLQAGGQTRPPLVFRYLRQPYGLELKTTRIEPEVDGKIFTQALVRDTEIDLRTTVRYTIRKRGIFGVRLRVPAGFKLLQCGDERTVKDHRLEDPSEEDAAAGLGQILEVDFVNQVKPGNFALTILGNIHRPEQPEEGEVPLNLPRFGLLDVEKETGVLGVGGQKHLQLTLGERKGLLPIGVRELRGLGFKHRAGNDEELTYGFKYGKPEGLSADFTVKRREPKVTAKVETLVDAQEEMVKVNTAIHYTVEHAGIEQVRIRVPAALASEQELKFEPENIKDRSAEVKDGKATWTISLQGKRTGTFAIRLSYDLKLDDFEAGNQKNVTLHELEVLDCFSETGDIALKKHENLVIAEDAMEMIDKRDKRELPEALRRQGPIQAYRYVSHPHTLTLQITKYDFQAPLGILIKHLHHEEVLDKEGVLKAEAWVELQNNAEQFLTVVLPAGAEMRGLLVDGKSEEWSEGEAIDGRPSLQVHLGEVTKVRRQEPFQIRLRYDLPQAAELSGRGELAFSTLLFPLADDQQVPVARLTRSTYLPEGYAYLEFDTDATKHFDETTLWEVLKLSLGMRTRHSRGQASEGSRAAQDAINRLKTLTPGNSDAGLYPQLELPQGQLPYLFEKLNNPSRLAVGYVSWTRFYVMDVLVLLAVIALGVFLDAKKLAGVVAYTAVAAGGALLGATFVGKALEPYFASAFVGSLGLGGFFFTRGIWRELTVLRHERRLEELAEQAKLARVRAEAAEAEARLRGEVQITAERPAEPQTPAEAKKAAAASAAEESAAAERIVLDEGTPAEGAAEGSASEGNSSEAPEGDAAQADAGNSDEGGSS